MRTNIKRGQRHTVVTRFETVVEFNWHLWLKWSSGPWGQRLVSKIYTYSEQTTAMYLSILAIIYAVIRIEASLVANELPGKSS